MSKIKKLIDSNPSAVLGARHRVTGGGRSRYEKGRHLYEDTKSSYDLKADRQPKHPKAPKPKPPANNSIAEQFEALGLFMRDGQDKD